VDYEIFVFIFVNQLYFQSVLKKAWPPPVFYRTLQLACRRGASENCNSGSTVNVIPGRKGEMLSHQLRCLIGKGICPIGFSMAEETASSPDLAFGLVERKMTYTLKSRPLVLADVVVEWQFPLPPKWFDNGMDQKTTQ
jgi:hypothetical protein